jgi:hypothetical protein
VDVSCAQLSNLGDRVELVDPGFPWTVSVSLAEGDDRPAVTTVTVVSRDDTPITSMVLAQIPIRQIASVAASALRGEGEAQYRMLARPRLPGKRSWPAGHYKRVARVAAWAKTTGRPGGVAETIAEFWGVHHRTARRWLERLAQASAQP